METIRQAFREQAVRFYEWLRGRDAALQQQREQTIPNGAIRQQHDPDYVQQQRQRVEQERQRQQEQSRGR